MLTSIVALEDVVGAELWLLGCIACFFVSFLIAFSIKSNRGKNTLRTSLGIVLPAIICDVVLFFIFFPNGEYINMGLSSVSWLFLYPLCLVVGVVSVSCLNQAKKRFSCKGDEL